MEMRKRVCRLCFKTCEHYQAVKANIRRVLDILQLKINLAISEEPVICINCAEALKNSFDFKAMCTHNHKVFILHKKENVKLDLNTVYLNKMENVSGIPEDQKVCVLCMGLVKKHSAISVDYENRHVMLEKCLSELDFSIINAPIICASCQESLQKYFYFTKDCSTVEEKIQKYCEAKGLNSEGVIELTDVQEFTSSGNSLDIIKEYKPFCDDGENVDVKVKHNSESLIEMKVQKFMPNESLICKSEVNEADTSTTATIYVENDIKIEHKYENFEDFEDQKLIDVSGSLMEAQDQKLKNVQQFTSELEDKKCLIVEEIEIKTEQNEFDSLLAEDSLPQPKVVNHLYGCYGSQTKCKKDVKTKHNSAVHKHGRGHKNSSDKTMYRCKSCSFKTKYKQSLGMHMLRHKNPSETTMYQCDCCSFQTKYPHHLPRHMLSHQNPSEAILYQCEYCPFKATHKNGLFKHVLTHKDPSEVEMYHCASCLFQTKHKQSLDRHMLVHKNPSELKMYQCDSCDYKTKYNISLRQHILIHRNLSEIRAYHCDSCSFKTKYKSSLRDHMVLHKPPQETTIYQCDSCSFQTKRKQSLNRHMLIHKDPSEIKMYQHAACPFRTKYKRSLQQHMLTHKKPSEIV